MLWLIRLRWAALAGQLFSFAVARPWLGLDAPMSVLCALTAFTAVSNLALSSLPSERTNDRTLGAVLAFDSLLLTAWLAASGGVTNPFSVFYLVHVTLGVVLLPPSWTWFLVALSAGGFAMLFTADRRSGSFASHLAGMWIAYTVAAALIAYFIPRPRALPVAGSSARS